MFALGYWYSVADGFDRDEWSVEEITDDITEASDNLFDARNQSAEGNDIWDGATPMLLVLRNGASVWEPLTEESWVE